MNGKTMGRRHITDLIMTVYLVALMLYFRTGQTVHEWLSVGAFVFFVLHHIWNRKWFLSLGKGRWTPDWMWGSFFSQAANASEAREEGAWPLAQIDL